MKPKDLAKYRRKITRKYPLFEEKSSSDQLYEVYIPRHHYYFWNLIPPNTRTNQIWLVMLAFLDVEKLSKKTGIRVFQLVSFKSPSIKVGIHPDDSRVLTIIFPDNLVECTKDQITNVIKPFLLSLKRRNLL